ncbi:MAG: hypothetical protein AB7L28_26235, partial [Kofleriaceae bacterium]
MNRFVIVTVMMSAASVAAEDPAPSPRSPLVAFLEQRVPEELATEGIMLGQRNLALKIEQAGACVLVFMHDAATGRQLAWSRIGELPNDRDAAVAAVTHVAADLAAKLVVTSTPQASAPSPTQDDGEEGGVEGGFAKPASGAKRAAALQEYQREAIRFTPRLEVTLSGHTQPIGSLTVSSLAGVGVERVGWPAVRGEHGVELAPAEFYTLVGRQDLADTYYQRQVIGIGGMVVGGAALVAGTYIFIKAAGMSTTDDGRCDPLFEPETLPQYDACTASYEAQRERDADAYRSPAYVLTGVGLVAATVGYLVYRHRHPVSENEAKGLADSYNQQLRHRLQLDGDDSPSREHERRPE